MRARWWATWCCGTPPPARAAPPCWQPWSTGCAACSTTTSVRWVSLPPASSTRGRARWRVRRRASPAGSAPRWPPPSVTPWGALCASSATGSPSRWARVVSAPPAARRARSCWPLAPASAAATSSTVALSSASEEPRSLRPSAQSADAAGLPCPCGGTGHLEAVASGPALLAWYLDRGGEDASSAREVARRAERDPLAGQALVRAGLCSAPPRPGWRTRSTPRSSS